MSAVNGNTGQVGFRIKWGNKEIEYFGDSSKDLFRTVFEYVQKNPETGIIESLPIFSDKLGEVKFKGEMPIDSNVDFEGYQRICVDTGVSVEQLQKVLTLQKGLTLKIGYPFFQRIRLSARLYELLLMRCRWV